MKSKLDINSFLKAGTSDSMMRLMSLRALNTAIVIALSITFGAIAGFILAIIIGRDLVLIGGAIGGLAGLGGALVGTLLIPAFGGKAAQSFAENNKQGINESK